ncbi:MULTISPECIES: lysophospholipid acyltransferase family protein [Candidatus Cardinium]|uniref:lysophospholipid acyltransferase family protein n=1 Tax=Candidatus Cardinium TaxID=273135 RepID=UPI001FA9A981|nr:MULTISPECIES: lysophospholipid acyltransferase family protein [Cardinium]
MLYRLCYLISLLPLRPLYLISRLLYIVIYYIIGYRKKIVQQNLTHSFPNKTKQECNQIKKAFYQYLSDLLLEHIKALTITHELLLERVALKDIEPLERCYQEGQSIILVSGHFGNWEWIANALALQTPYTLCAGYQPLHDQEIDQMARHIRSRFQRKAMPMAALFRYIRSYKGPPQATTLLIDQAPFHKHNTHATIFLNQTTKVALTAAKLAQTCNQPIFYIAIDRIKRGSYIARPILLTKTPTQLSPESIAESYTRKLEANILRNPALWIWSHRRWK